MKTLDLMHHFWQNVLGQGIPIWKQSPFLLFLVEYFCIQKTRFPSKAVILMYLKNKKNDFEDYSQVHCTC